MENIMELKVDFNEGELYGVFKDKIYPIEHNSLGGIKLSVNDNISCIIKQDRRDLKLKAFIVDSYKVKDGDVEFYIYGYITNDEITSENVSFFVIRYYEKDDKKECVQNESYMNKIITVKRDNVLNYEREK